MLIVEFSPLYHQRSYKTNKHKEKRCIYSNEFVVLESVGTAKGLHSNEIMLANCSIRICPLKSARIVKTAVQFFSNKTETTQARRKVKIGFDSTNPRRSGGVTRRPLASRFLSKVGVQSLSSFSRLQFFTEAY